MGYTKSDGTSGVFEDRTMVEITPSYRLYLSTRSVNNKPISGEIGVEQFEFVKMAPKKH